MNARRLIAVDGIDGSGKSQFARALAEACAAEGETAVVLHVDDFRRPVSWPAGGSAEGGSDEASLYYDRYYDLEQLDASLRAFLAGEAGVTVPRFDSTRDQLDGEQRLSFQGATLAFVEGVFVLRVPVAAAAPLIALEVAESEARARILTRDLARGRARTDIENRIDHRYFPAQRRYRAAHEPARVADVLIDNNDWTRPRLLRAPAATFPGCVTQALSRIVRP